MFTTLSKRQHLLIHSCISYTCFHLDACRSCGTAFLIEMELSSLNKCWEVHMVVKLTFIWMDLESSFKNNNHILTRLCDVRFNQTHFGMNSLGFVTFVCGVSSLWRALWSCSMTFTFFLFSRCFYNQPLTNEEHHKWFITL